MSIPCPEVINPKTVKTVEGEGMPCTGAAERRRGDLVIRFNVAFPQQVSQGDQLTLKTVLNKK